MDESWKSTTDANIDTLYMRSCNWWLLAIGSKWSCSPQIAPKTMKYDRWPTLLIGFVIGIVCVFPLNLILTEYTKDIYENAVLYSTVALLMSGVSFLFLFANRNSIIHFLFGRTRSTFQGVLLHTFRAAAKMQDGNPRLAYRHLKRGLMGGLAAYSWWAIRLWTVRVLFTLVAIFAAAVGTFLLIEQNHTLREQNKKLDSQTKALDKQVELFAEQNRRIEVQTEQLKTQNRLTHQRALLSEAQRRAAYLPMLNSIIDQIITTRTKYDALNKNRKPLNLGPTLSSQIVALAGLLRPYHVLDGLGSSTKNSVALQSQFLSPERGILLRTLLDNHINLKTEFFQNANFRYSDMRGYYFTGPNQSLTCSSTGALVYYNERVTHDLYDLSYVDLSFSNFGNARIANAYFGKAVAGMRFSNATLNKVMFDFNEGDVIVFFDKSSITNLYINSGNSSKKLAGFRGANIFDFRDSALYYTERIPGCPLMLPQIKRTHDGFISISLPFSVLHSKSSINKVGEEEFFASFSANSMDRSSFFGGKLHILRVSKPFDLYKFGAESPGQYLLECDKRKFVCKNDGLDYHVVYTMQVHDQK